MKQILVISVIVLVVVIGCYFVFVNKSAIIKQKSKKSEQLTKAQIDAIKNRPDISNPKALNDYKATSGRG